MNGAGLLLSNLVVQLFVLILQNVTQKAVDMNILCGKLLDRVNRKPNHIIISCAQFFSSHFARSMQTAIPY